MVVGGGRLGPWAWAGLAWPVDPGVWPGLEGDPGEVVQVTKVPGGTWAGGRADVRAMRGGTGDDPKGQKLGQKKPDSLAYSGTGSSDTP